MCFTGNPWDKNVLQYKRKKLCKMWETGRRLYLEFFIVFNRTLLMMIEQKGLFPRRGILAIVSTDGGSNKLFPLFWVHQRSDLLKKGWRRTSRKIFDFRHNPDIADGFVPAVDLNMFFEGFLSSLSLIGSFWWQLPRQLTNWESEITSSVNHW